jgi:hypothetical protein
MLCGIECLKLIVKSFLSRYIIFGEVVLQLVKIFFSPYQIFWLGVIVDWSHLAFRFKKTKF